MEIRVSMEDVELKRMLGKLLRRLTALIRNSESPSEIEEEGNSTVLFAEEECDLGREYREVPPDIYSRYKKWCGEKGIRALGKQHFYRQIYITFQVKRIRPTNDTREFFSGIRLKSTKEC